MDHEAKTKSGSNTIAFAKFDTVNKDTIENLTRYFLFRLIPDVHTNQHPLRWDVNRETILYSYPFHLHQVSWSLNRVPINALRPGWLDSQYCIDRSKIMALRARDSRAENLFSESYGGLEPIVWASIGIRGWNEGDTVMRDGLGMLSKPWSTDTFFDFVARNDREIELFYVIDGKLTRWLYDGKDWSLEKYMTVELDGPFLVYKKGEALVTERDGKWCRIEGLTDKTQRVIPFAAVVENEPLTLIETGDGEIQFFQAGRKLYDAQGATVTTLAKRPKTADLARLALDAVQSARR